MSKQTIVFVVSALALATWACSSSPEERSRSATQRLEGDPAVPAGPAACTHAICATGEGLVAACDPCATSLCAADPYCCSTAWDGTCVGEVTSICGQSCTVVPDAGTGGACAHPVCAAGPALEASCTQCATDLCAQDPYCCSTAWDATCVGEVASICGPICQ
ncbi:MAG TPA: hypothetical protein VLT33_31685 [Labilithrix sp.]|nr:hypothetical protein [Labilithrix sp.]